MNENLNATPHNIWLRILFTLLEALACHVTGTASNLSWYC